MASRAFWSDDELAVLRDHVHERHWIEKVMPKINRGENALRMRMAKLRAEIGMSDRRCSWQRDAKQASADLAEALGRTIRQPTCRIWCGQCEQLVDDVRAQSCGSQWCKAKDRAA